MDRERRFREILTRLCGTKSCINFTRLAHWHRVSCNIETVPNAPERKETHQKMSLGSNGVDRERSLRKILARHRGMNICNNCTVSLWHKTWCKTRQNMSLRSNSVDWEHSLQKILTRHHGLNFCIYCTSLACSKMHPNGNKHTKT